MIEKRESSFHVSEEAVKHLSQSEYLRLARDAWLKAWQEEQQLTAEAREARRAERKSREIDEWRAVRADHKRVIPTLELLMDVLYIDAAEAEHYVQPYCYCDYPLDSESGSRCQYYDLDINPPQEDTE